MAFLYSAYAQKKTYTQYIQYIIDDLQTQGNSRKIIFPNIFPMHKKCPSTSEFLSFALSMMG